MLRKSIILTIIVLSLVFFQATVSAEIESSNNEDDSTNLILFLGIVYLILAIGVIGYFYEVDTGKRKDSLHIESDFNLPKQKKREPFKIENVTDEFNKPYIYDCPICEKKYVSLSPEWKAQCPHCKTRD